MLTLFTVYPPPRCRNLRLLTRRINRLRDLCRETQILSNFRRDTKTQTTEVRIHPLPMMQVRRSAVRRRRNFQEDVQVRFCILWCLRLFIHDKKKNDDEKTKSRYDQSRCMDCLQTQKNSMPAQLLPGNLSFCSTIQ